jgi:hypothetical protein
MVQIALHGLHVLHGERSLIAKANLRTWLLVVAVIALGSAITVANRHLPLVRNSLVYASAAQHVIDRGYDPRPVVADSKLSYDKPILYSWMSAPFVARLGSHDGLRLTSWIGTVAYLLAVVFFAGAVRSRLPAGGETALVWLSAIGPCVFYQFWSAHPDTWFAALVLLAWGLTIQIVDEPGPRAPLRMVLLGVVIYIALLMKNFGLVLGISCPAYFLWHYRRLRTSPSLKTLIATTAVVFAALGVAVILAWTGHNSFSRLEGEGGGVGQYGRGVFFTSARGTWIQVGIALLLQAQVAFAFAFARRAWVRDFISMLVCFGLIYVVALMPFPTTFYNMRYFVPLFPLVAMMLVRGAAAFAPSARRAIWIGHAVVGAGLILIFNIVPAYRAALPIIPNLEVNWIGTPLSLLDNLRMALHLEQAAVLDRINAAVPPNGTIYMLDVNYYGDAERNVFERAGLIRSDISTRYVTRRTFQPDQGTSFVWAFSKRPPAVPGGGTVTSLGDNIYRLDR